MKIHEYDVQYIVDKKGHKKGILLTIEQYEKLMEDLHDLAVIAQRSKEKVTSF
jgi:PHD/YefM family antitoxin component YafN of YafNO toxin-antitoxin module